MTNNKKYIGIFDSGVGGLTVVRALLKQMPNENIIYLADNKHLPYGDKSNEEIIKYTHDNMSFLNSFNLKAVVIACNTADSIAGTSLKQNYSLPIFGVIDATAKKAASTTQNYRVGVIATAGTIKSNEYQKQILNYNPTVKVFNQACPFLTPLIEEGKFDIGNQEIRDILKDYLNPLIKCDIDTLVLGCTHYDLLFPIIQDMCPNLNIVSSSRCVIDTIKKNIPENKDIGEQQFFVTGDADHFNKIASMIIIE